MFTVIDIQIVILQKAINNVFNDFYKKIVEINKILN